MKHEEISGLLLLWRKELADVHDDNDKLDLKYSTLNKLKLKRISKEIKELLEELEK